MDVLGWMSALTGMLVLGAALAEGVRGDDPAVALANPGFEQLDDKGSPAPWFAPPGFQPAEPSTDAPRSGRTIGRIAGDGTQRAWRQKVPSPATRIYSASGWFRAKDVRIDTSAKDFARFYFHILYKDRPYAEATHAYVDLPPGTYGWRRFGVQLVPRLEHPVSEIWVTVAAKLRSGTLDFDDLDLSEAPPRGGRTAMTWANFAKATMLCDMRTAQPADALSERAKHGKWKVFSYEFGGHKGHMVWGSEETEAPALTIPLNAKGWHAVYLGLADPSRLGCRALVRLSRDPAFVPRSREEGFLNEVLFKVADLTDQSLHLAQCVDAECRPCGLAYLKLVPLTEKEVAAVKADRADVSNRRLVATIDGFSYIYSRRPVSRQALLEEVEVYRNTDFGTLILQTGGADMVNYPSKIGEMLGQDLDDFPRPGDRRYAEAIRELAAKGVNPTKTLIDGAHDVGMKVHVSIRPAAWVHSEPMSDFFTSRFYRDHPEWRCIDRDGTLVARMSLAVPEVRARLIDVLREALRFGADGANVLFIRGVPFVLYEKPFCDRFQKAHGCGPKTLDEDDPRILALRGEIVTTFLREIRQMLDEEGKARGGAKLALSVNVLSNETDNLRYGVDVRRWAKEGLVNLVCPHQRAGGDRTRKLDLAFFKEACSPHGVRFAPAFTAWRMRGLSDAVRSAAAYYDAGADGLTFWDANCLAPRMTKWSVVSRMGHVEELKERVGEGPPRPVTARFHKLGGLVMDGPYYPNWGY